MTAKYKICLIECIRLLETIEYLINANTAFYKQKIQVSDYQICLTDYIFEEITNPIKELKEITNGDYYKNVEIEIKYDEYTYQLTIPKSKFFRDRISHIAFINDITKTIKRLIFRVKSYLYFYENGLEKEVIDKFNIGTDYIIIKDDKTDGIKNKNRPTISNIDNIDKLYRIVCELETYEYGEEIIADNNGINGDVKYIVKKGFREIIPPNPRD